MEFIPTKRHKKWKKKRYLKRKRLHERIRIEVKSAKHWEVFPGYINTFDARRIGTSTMQADAFWKNYASAQEWQKRHTITWWRSRCLALEYENEILRDKVRLLAQHRTYPNITRKNNYYEENHKTDMQEEKYTEFNSNIGDVEFNVNEDMLKFFEISERHKRELKQTCKSKEIKKENSLEEIPIIDDAEMYKKKNFVEDIPIIDDAEKICMRKQEADLLYGDDSFKILAMETALETATNKYKDIMNPQYWPNMPLKP
ncbi:Gem-associated protein 8 [Camponotus japonicus]